MEVRFTAASCLGSNITLFFRFHRSITRPAFSRDRISDYELFDQHAKIVISQLKKRLREGYAVDFQVRAFDLLLQVIYLL